MDLAGDGDEAASRSCSRRTGAIVPIILFVQAGFWHWPSVFLIANIWSGIGLGLFLQSHVKKINKLILICVLLFETGSFTHYYFTDYAKDEIKANRPFFQGHEQKVNCNQESQQA